MSPTNSPVLQLPLEVWHRILEFFRVSQLGCFARVCRCWYHIQERMPAWKTALESDGLASFAARQHRRMCVASLRTDLRASAPQWLPVVRDVADYLMGTAPSSSSSSIVTHRDAYVAIARWPEFGRLLLAPSQCLPHGEHPELAEQLSAVSGCSPSSSCLFSLFESLWSQFEEWLLRNGLLAQFATLEPVDFDTSALPEALAAMLLVGGRQGLKHFRFVRDVPSRLRALATPASPSHLSLLSLLPASLAQWNIPLHGDNHTRRGRRRDEGEGDNDDDEDGGNNHHTDEEVAGTTVVSTSPAMALFGVARYYHTCLPRWYTTHSVGRSTIDTGEGVIFAFLYVSVMHVVGVVLSVPDTIAEVWGDSASRDEEEEEEEGDYEGDGDDDESERSCDGRAARMKVGQVVFLSLHHARHPIIVAPNIETFFYRWVRDVCWLKRFDLDSSRRSISLYPRCGHPRVHGISVAVTRGVEVIMSPIYLYDSSQPFKHSFRYAYQCRMRLLPSSPFQSVQLTHRRWIIRSNSGEEVVEGEGVIGLFPILERMTEKEADESDAERGLGYGSLAQSTFNKLFFYASCTNFESRIGFMRGSFRFVPGSVGAPLGLPFDAEVAEFTCQLSEGENALYGGW